MESNNNEEKNVNKAKQFFMDWILPIGAAIIIAILINKFLIFNVYVPTGSMIPTINEEDKGIVTRVYNPENLNRGDIVVFYSDELEKTLVKRLIGLPGDKIQFKNGVLYLNGEKVEEDYVKNKDNYNGSFEVPEGKYFFAGDNRPVSNDARYWKNPYIDESKIEGKFRFRFYPLKDFGTVK